jgi:hypothetical protein
MTHPDDIVPSNLDEAVKVLKDSLTEEDLNEIRRPMSVSTQCHFGYGMAMRNAWSLWDTETRLVKWFKDNYGVEHADDISGIILECLWNDVRGEPRRDKILAERFIKHWQMSKEATETGKTLRFKIGKDGEISDYYLE